MPLLLVAPRRWPRLRANDRPTNCPCARPHACQEKLNYDPVRQSEQPPLEVFNVKLLQASSNVPALAPEAAPRKEVRSSARSNYRSTLHFRHADLPCERLCDAFTQALEVKLRQAPTPTKAHRGSGTRREALEVKLKRGGERQPELPADRLASDPRREALEVKLKKGAERQPEVPAGLPESREGLAQLEQLRRVPSNQRANSGLIKRVSVEAMRRRASSLLEMAGGLKPSLLKAKQQQGAGGDGSSGDGGGDEMVEFVTSAHANLKNALAAQQAELARIEAEMEAERLAAEARAAEEERAAERKERKAMLERHLQRQQAVRQQAEAEADMQAEAERLAAEEEAARIERLRRACSPRRPSAADAHRTSCTERRRAMRRKRCG